MLTCLLLAGACLTPPHVSSEAGVLPRRVIAQAVAAPLRVGGTYYVTASLLNMRGKPTAEVIAVYQVSRNTPLLVRELPANPNWVLVEFTMGDEGIVAYVSRWYLSATRAE